MKTAKQNANKRKRAAGNSPTKLTVLGSAQEYDIKSFKKLQDIRDIAWHNALKYTWDPVLSQTHNEYLNMLNNLIRECAV